MCELTSLFHSLEIPYLVSVIGDSEFKIILKELEEKHSFENLQCLSVKRSNIYFFSCLKTAIDKFKSLKGEDA